MQALLSRKKPALSQQDLKAFFLRGCKKKIDFRVGVEWEKLGVCRRTGLAIPYYGPRGVKALFQALISQYGWRPVLSQKGEPIALKRGEASLTLEPGGQIELSGQKADQIQENAQELLVHLAEIKAVSEPLDVAWLGLGAQPFSTQEDMEWVPKDRYDVMRDLLKGRGAQTYSMMKETASIQVSLDYSSEEDAIQKFRLAMALSPYLTALFANSAYENGLQKGFLSRRADIWQHTDPARTGILWRALRPGFCLEDYIDYALHVPMFFIQRKTQWIRVKQLNFKTFMTSGYRGYHATADDWALHLTTLFTEARLKNYLEIRSIDCQRADMGLAAVSFLKGLFYDPAALAGAQKLLLKIPITSHMEIFYQAPRKALRSKAGKVQAWHVARALYEIAKEGSAKSDRRYLEPMDDIVRTGKCPAELFAQKHGPAGHRGQLLKKLIAYYAL